MSRKPLIPALVLAAGRGTRLDPLTRLVAKAAVPLGDRTLIEHAIAWLRAQQVTELVVNLHHHPESITAVLADGAHLGVRVRYSWEATILGSGGGPRRALPLLGESTFVIVNGDTLCNFDLAPMLADHERNGAAVTLAVVPNPSPDHYNGLRIDAGDCVTGVDPAGPAAQGTWHFVGVQIVQAAVFAPLTDGVPAETIAGFYRGLIAERPGAVRVWRPETTFIDVGTPADYLRAATALGGASDRGVVVWPGSIVDAGASIERCVVAGGVAIPAGFAATDAVLVPAALARDGDRATVRGGVAVFPIATTVA